MSSQPDALPDTDETAEALWELAGRSRHLGELLRLVQERTGGQTIAALVAFRRAFDMSLSEATQIVAAWDGFSGSMSAEELEHTHGDWLRARRRARPQRTKWSPSPHGGWIGEAVDDEQD